jgi:hypothetical protein
MPSLLGSSYRRGPSHHMIGQHGAWGTFQMIHCRRVPITDQVLNSSSQLKELHFSCGYQPVDFYIKLGILN